jgi:AraC family transcriptional regulator
MSAAAQTYSASEKSHTADIRDLAASVIWLLRSATEEVERDCEAAKSSIARASSLLQVEADRHGGPGTKLKSGGLAPWQMQRVRMFVEERLSQSIHIEDLSTLIGLSKTHFSRAFKQSFGDTPHVYILRRRVELARHLMLTTDTPLAELAVACGLSDQAHLSRLFRHYTGESPAAWRRDRRQPVHPARRTLREVEFTTPEDGGAIVQTSKHRSAIVSGCFDLKRESHAPATVFGA